MAHAAKILATFSASLAALALSAAANAHIGCDAAPRSSSTAARALELCRGVDTLPDDERERALQRGLRLAEQAAASNACDPVAHLAISCNLGKRIELRGVGLGQLGDIKRVNRELDIALSLAPQNADILAAKGVVLMRLPKLFGGDAEAGASLLRQALARDPENEEARRYLTELASGE